MNIRQREVGRFRIENLDEFSCHSWLVTNLVYDKQTFCSDKETNAI